MREGEYQARIDRLIELRRYRAALDAEEARILHALVTDPPQIYPVLDPEGDKQWVREEVSCALKLAPVTAAAKLAEARQLVECLPTTLDLLAAGEITAPHAGRLVEATFGLDAKTIAAVDVEACGGADAVAVPCLHPPRRPRPRTPEAGRGTPCRSGRRAAGLLHPARRRHHRTLGTPPSRDRRRHPSSVGHPSRPVEDPGRANPDGAQRTADQRRADALPELIFGTTSIQPRVNVTVALSTLLNLDNQPGELDRHGPITAPHARTLAFNPHGTWRRLLTDHTGQVLEVGPAYPAPPPPEPTSDRITIENPTRPARDERSREEPADRHAARAPARRGASDRPRAQRARRDRTTHPAEESVWRLPDRTTRWRAPAGHTCDRPPDEIPRDATNDPPATGSTAA